MAGRKVLDKTAMLVASLARDHTEKAIKKLAELMERGENEAVQKAAADSLLDRGWGKPAQAVTVGGDADNPLNVKTTYEVVFKKPEK